MTCIKLENRKKCYYFTSVILTCTTIEKFFKEINTFIQQECIQFIKLIYVETYNFYITEIYKDFY